MSADLFAAFEDASDRSSKGHQQKTSVQTSSFASDPFSFRLGSVTNSSYNTRQNASSISQQWNNGSTQWSDRLQNTQQPSGSNTWLNAPLQPNHSKPKVEEDDDEDGWGDFEVAENSNQPPAPSAASAASASLSGATTKEPQNPALLRTRVVRASTMDLITNNLLDISNLSISQGKTAESSPAQAASKRVEMPTPKDVSLGTQKKATNPNPNVLFDADDFGGEQREGEDDEDFGEFETVVSPAQKVPDLLSMGSSPTSETDTKPRAANMLSPLNLTNPVSYPQAPRSPSFQERNPFPGLAVATPTADKHFTNDPKTSPVTAWPSLNAQKSAGSEGFGDDWGAFDDFPDEEAKSNTKTKSDWDWDSIEPAQLKPPTTQAPPPTAPKPQNSSWDWDPVDIKTEQQNTEPKNGLPPTNVPPPSVLLSVFPELLAQANASLYKPISGQPFPIKNRILSDPKTIEFLKGYLALATVLARVIAGRKLRWHRDKLLLQKMSISAAGSKGMKLAGVDKAQAAREDREAADVVANWKEQIGRLRSAVAAANSSIKNKTEQLKIPEISESMPIQNEKMVPTAPKACVVCGLKRNERIPKVDYEVEDSFGEWWVDHWGHLACKRFWLQHENTLRQR